MRSNGSVGSAAILGLDNTGAARLKLNSNPGATLRIQSSTDLIHWGDLTSVANPTGTVEFLDTGASGLAFRFYRLVGP